MIYLHKRNCLKDVETRGDFRILGLLRVSHGKQQQRKTVSPPPAPHPPFSSTPWFPLGPVRWAGCGQPWRMSECNHTLSKKPPVGPSSGLEMVIATLLSHPQENGQGRRSARTSEVNLGVIWVGMPRSPIPGAQGAWAPGWQVPQALQTSCQSDSP